MIPRVTERRSAYFIYYLLNLLQHNIVTQFGHMRGSYVIVMSIRRQYCYKAYNIKPGIIILRFE